MTRPIVLFVLALSLYGLSLLPLTFGSEPQQNPQRNSEDRLIELNNGTQQWMSPEEIQNLSNQVHMQGKCGGFFDVTDMKPILKPFTLKSVPIDYSARELKQNDWIEKYTPELSAKNLEETVKTLSALPNRYYKSKDGVAGATWIKNKFEQIANGRNDIEVQFFNHTNFSQPSVIARIKGRGKLAAERIIIGAHEDSINQWQRDKAAPGADDDASGVATVIEIFRVLVESGYQPERTLEFMTYAGEELGLLGSQEIAASYANQSVAVAGVLQFDMTMYPGTHQSLTFITDHVHPELTTFLQKVTDTYVKLPWMTSECDYACSDHASWTKYGFMSGFPFEAPFDDYNKKIHTVNDVLTHLSPEFGLQFAKLGLAYIVELGQDSAKN